MRRAHRDRLCSRSDIAAHSWLTPWPDRLLTDRSVDRGALCPTRASRKMVGMVLDDLPTPSLVLDLDRLERNCDRMFRRAAKLRVQLRPHMKTAKSVDVGRLATRERSVGVTVSTLAEAEQFAEAGFGDITYAVGTAGHKIPALAELQRRTGARISLLADTVAAVHDVARPAEAEGER